MAQKKVLLLAALVLFASFISIANAAKAGVSEPDEDDDYEEPEDRDEGLGGGDRRPQEIGGDGDDFRGLKINRQTADGGNDTVSFTFRAFPVPRVRVRYFDGDVDAEDIEDDDVDAKLELVVQIPAYFYFVNGDEDPAFNETVDTVKRIVNLRRDNGDAWKPLLVEEFDVDFAHIFKFTLARKVGDFSLVAYVVNDTVTFEGFDLKTDTAKFNIEYFTPLVSQLTADDRVAFLVKVRHFDDFDIEDRSEENEEKKFNGEPETRNDVTIGIEGEDVAAFFNWEKFVTLTSASVGGAVAQSDVAIYASEVDVDKLSVDKFTPGGVPVVFPSSDGDSTSEDPEDDEESYSESREDPHVFGRLTGLKAYVFAVDSSLIGVTKFVWDPTPGITSAATALIGADETVVTPDTTETTESTSDETPEETTDSTGSGNGVGTVSISFQVLIALFAIFSVLV